MTWTEPWSPSRLNMLERCAEQFRRRYILGEKTIPDLGLVRGRCVDDAVTASLGSKITTGALLSQEAVADTARDSVKRETTHSEWTPGPDYEELGKGAVGYVTDEVVSMSQFHNEMVAPSLRPDAVQLKIEADADDVIPVPTLGIIDVTCPPLIDPAGRILAPAEIRDTKTSRKSPNADAAETSTQLTFYAALIEAVQPWNGSAGGSDDPLLTLDFVWRTKGGTGGKRGKPTPPTLGAVTLETRRTAADIAQLGIRLAQAQRQVELEVFPPTGESNPMCSERFCGYARTCPYFRGRARPTT